MAFRPLCSHCKQINFDALRGPQAIEIERLAADEAPPGHRHAQVKPGTSLGKVGLGTLSRIRKEARECPLCALFYRIINRQGAVYRHDSAHKTLDTSDIHFVADPDLSYYAKIGGLNTANTGVFIFRRLNLTAHPITSSENPIAYLDNVLQVCDVGTLTAPAKDPAMHARQIPEKMPFGGRKRPYILDLQLVHDWMDICADEHGRLCLLDSTQVDSTHMNLFRLIDVHQKSIQEIHDFKVAKLTFMALSYVWGLNPKVKLLKANYESLRTPGGLSKLQLPRTIADSIELVDLLGLQYLWVDALCIIQDDANDQSYQISKMANIYSSAFLTIMAASGEDSNAGLPGFGSSIRRYEQQEVVVIPRSENSDGLSVMNTLKACPQYLDEWYTRGKEDADSSKWSQRAWTMQEKALSRRTLVFTDEQVFWNCQQAYYCEESYFEVPRTRVNHFYPSIHRLSIQQLSEANSDSWQLYEDLINNYMRRDLSYQGDVHAACQGILDAMDKSTKSGFLWGLPLSRFELALMWETFHGVSRRTALSTFPMTSDEKQVMFPSWSWMGWSGDIHCRVSDDRRESERPLVVCFVHRKNPLRFCHVTPTVEEVTTSDTWTDSCIQEQELSFQHVKQHLPNLTEDVLVGYAEEMLLFFWSHSAYFNVVYDKTSRPATSFTEYTDQTRPIVQDVEGNNVGFVCKTGAARSEDELKEFVAVGQRQILGIPESLAEDICPPFILALQIDRDQYGIASRVNYAEIGLKAWMHAEPRVALVALQ